MREHDQVQMLRLCFVADGQSIHTRRWIAFFARRRHQVHLITDYPCSIEGVSVYYLPPVSHAPVLRHFIQALAIRRLIRKIRPDILHSHFIKEDGWYGALAGFHPFFLTGWGSDVYMRGDNWFYRALSRLAVKAADIVTVDSEDQKTALVAIGASPNKVTVVQWGVDLERFTPQVSPGLRKQLGLPDGPIILSLRQLKKIYNVDIIMEAFARLLTRYKNAILVVLDTGPDLEDLKNRAGRLGIVGSVKFVGPQPYEMIPEYLVASDIVVSVPSSDGTSMSMLEAMACGKPVVATDLPSAREWIQDGVNGCLVPVRDPDRLAGSLLFLLDHPEIAARYGQNAIQVVRERADHQKHMLGVETLYYSRAVKR